MSTTLPASSDAVNPQPGFYALIPAPVRYCKQLPPAAKLLFGEIVALTSVKGFCYAQNPYFMALYDVDRATIKRWLAALVAQGFIRVEHDRFTNERRIYADAMLPGGVAQKRATPSAETRHPQRKSAPQSITLNNTESTTGTLNVASAGAETRAATAGRGSDAGEGRAEGAASPLSVHALNVQDVDAVVVITGDGRSRKRFQQLRELAEGAGCLDAWRQALDALNARLVASTGPVERPGAYFCSVLVSGLNARGVAVPVATPSQRRTVRDAIRSSLASVAPSAEA